MLILGVNAFHGDSAAALVRDGVLIAAAEEERFRRIKHWAGFPTQSIAYCLQEAGVRIQDIDHVAVNQDNKAQIWRKIFYILSHQLRPALLTSRLKTRQRRMTITELLQQSFPNDHVRARLHHVEHHLCHMFSAYYVSPFSEAAVLSVDGFGDFSSAAWGMGHNGCIDVLGRVYFPHSLGLFYQALTQYLGFPNYGDEYKVMGLAAYGTPSYLRQMREIVRLKEDGFRLDLSYFRHHIEQLPMTWSDDLPRFVDLFTPVLENLLGPRRMPPDPVEGRHRDIASSAQAMYEEAFFHLLEPLQANGKYPLTLAGGCAANSVANGKVRRKTRFSQIYVQPAAGDAGGAIGAAFAAWQKLGGKRQFVMDHAFWGPHFSSDHIKQLLHERQRDIAEHNCAIDFIPDEQSLCTRVAQLIADGKVVGWFQGRMEWGPRALGNRSILADPRRADIKTLLNDKIKRRESFRPFAPSVLDFMVGDWFEENDAVPFMMQVFQIRPEKRERIPAVTHVDGSGRLQTVCRVANRRYYRLIEAFFDITDVPMVLNTSFNENEPVVCAPEEALNCFLRTRMDALILDDFLIQREVQ